MEVVSVIIPIYNGEEYLRRCLDSIQNQNFKDFEVLMIDDGSTDSTSKICEEYCSIDRRFKYFYQTNSGVSVARNVGIEKAKGDYIAFIDCDDYVLESYLNVLITSIKKTNSDICYCKGYDIDECGNILNYDGIYNNNDYVVLSNEQYDWMDNVIAHCVVWGGYSGNQL